MGLTPLIKPTLRGRGRGRRCLKAGKLPNEFTLGLSVKEHDIFHRGFSQVSITRLESTLAYALSTRHSSEATRSLRLLHHSEAC